MKAHWKTGESHDVLIWHLSNRRWACLRGWWPQACWLRVAPPPAGAYGCRSQVQASSVGSYTFTHASENQQGHTTLAWASHTGTCVGEGVSVGAGVACKASHHHGQGMLCRLTSRQFASRVRASEVAEGVGVSVGAGVACKHAFAWHALSTPDLGAKSQAVRMCARACRPAAHRRGRSRSRRVRGCRSSLSCAATDEDHACMAPLFSIWAEGPQRQSTGRLISRQHTTGVATGAGVSVGGGVACSHMQSTFGSLRLRGFACPAAGMGPH